MHAFAAFTKCYLGKYIWTLPSALESLFNVLSVFYTVTLYILVDREKINSGLAHLTKLTT